ASSIPVMPGSLGSSFGGGMIVTDWRQRGQSTLNGSVGSRVSSKLMLIAHCGQLAIILDLSSFLSLPGDLCGSFTHQASRFTSQLFQRPAVWIRRALGPTCSCALRGGSTYHPRCPALTTAAISSTGLSRRQARLPE